MKRAINFFKTFLFFSLLAVCLNSHAAVRAPEKVLKVGIVDPVPPFVIATHSAYTGISITIWQLIAESEHLKYQYVPLNMTTEKAINLLQHGDIDVLIGPISVTFDRFKKVDFSYPYFLNSVGIIEYNNEHVSNFKQLCNVFRDIFKSPFLIAILIFFIIYAHILWVAEKEHNPFFHKRYRRGISNVFWMHLLQKGFKHIPATLAGRFLSLIWMIIAATFVTAMVAIVTSNLTIALVNKPEYFSHVADFQDQNVAAVKGTNAYIEMKKVGAHMVATDTLQEAIELLEQKKVVAVAEDYILAKNYLDNRSFENMHLSTLTVSNDEYAFALQKNSPLLRRVNRQILSLQDNDSTVEMCAGYIGSDAKLCKL